MDMYNDGGKLVKIDRIIRKSECLLFARQKVYGRVLRAAVQFDHVTLFFFNILWCTDELTLLRVYLDTWDNPLGPP